MTDSIAPPIEPTGFETGLTVEHILLSVTIVSTKESAGQFDDSCAHQLQKAMMTYHGVKTAHVTVFYEHGKVKQHSNTCECGHCSPSFASLIGDGSL
jgi:hypothetical protein